MVTYSITHDIPILPNDKSPLTEEKTIKHKLKKVNNDEALNNAHLNTDSREEITFNINNIISNTNNTNINNNAINNESE